MAAAGHPLVAAVQWIDEPPLAGAARRWRAGVPARRLGLPRAGGGVPVRDRAEVRVDAGLAGRRRAGRATPATWRPARCSRPAACRSPTRPRRAEADAALAAADRIGYPVVLKALGAEHKSDAGGVVLGHRRRPAELAAAVADLRGAARRRRRSASSGWWSRPSSAELVCGVIWDPRFGPVALVGGGGTAVELLDDVVLALAPLTPAEAEAALRRLRTFPLLDGYRGRPRLALARGGRGDRRADPGRGGASGAGRGRDQPAARHAGLRSWPSMHVRSGHEHRRSRSMPS